MTRADSYAAAGVDVEAANRTKQRIRSLVRGTFTPEVLSDIGGFGGLFEPRWNEYEHPVLVASVDSVGTKLKVAFRMDRHDTVGIDIVAHCANDILVQGAQPLFFLDYIGMGKHLGEVVERVVAGVAEGCKRVGCVLLGGEMAELPEFYQQGEYDLAGTMVGVVDRERIIDGSTIRPGDKILGLASDGLHTNGYSLARKLIFQQAKLGVDTYVDALSRTIGEELLRPHRSYVRPVLEVYRTIPIKGIAHITGGGFQDNIPRVLPDGASVEISLGTWPTPAIFSFLQEIGNVTLEEMYHVFNMGIGMVAILSPEDEDAAAAMLEAQGEEVFHIGRVTAGDGDVTFV
jgi:phosphoribosylformylglycinamidine cyclo-ligase